MTKVKQEPFAPNKRQCLNRARLKTGGTSPAQGAPAAAAKGKLAMSLSPSPKRAAVSSTELLRGASGGTKPPLDLSESQADTAQPQDASAPTEPMGANGGAGACRGTTATKNHNAYA